jgi:hypothetical protein
MKFILSTRSIRLIVLGAMLHVAGVVGQTACAQAVADPAFQLSISGTSQNIVLSWFAENGVAYQLESSADLLSWSNLGPMSVGSGGIGEFPIVHRRPDPGILSPHAPACVCRIQCRHRHADDHRE